VRRSLRRVAGPLLAVLALLAAGAVARGGAAEGPYLDPGSTSRSGTRALVDTLRQLGIDVEVPGDARRAARALDGAEVALVLGIDAGLDDELEDLLANGGRVVVAVPRAPLVDGLTPAAPEAADGIGRTLRTPDCALLPDVGPVASRSWAGFVVPAEGTGCFGSGGPAAWLVAVPRGPGLLVALGGPEPLVNAELREADNAVLAASLLATGTGTLVVLGPAVVGAPTTGGIGDLVPLRARHLLLATVLLAVVAAAWRGRRYGPVVTEPLPVRVPGGELVRAVADLQQRAGLVGPAGAAPEDDETLVRLGRDLAAVVAEVTGDPAHASGRPASTDAPADSTPHRSRP
jgi:hypothetical protein